MVIWLSALPLGLYGSCGWATVPLACTIAFLLLGIDEIGVQIEEPFGLLPLDDLCGEIENDLFEMVRGAEATKRTARAAAAAALGQPYFGEGSVAPYSPLPSIARGSSTKAKGGPMKINPVLYNENFGTNTHPEWDENISARRSDGLDEGVDEGM